MAQDIALQAAGRTNVPPSQMDPRVLAAKMIARRQRTYLGYKAYYDGDQRMAFASEKFRNAFGRLFYKFADNLCPSVVDAIADRLKVVGFAVEDGAPTLGEDAWKMWQKNRLERKSREVHQEALRCGDAYVIVWPHPETEEPCFYPQCSEQMTILYDDEVPGRMLWAAKAWRNLDGFVRMNVYYPDRIEKWITTTKRSTTPDKPDRWRQYADEGEPWPLVNKWGRVPVFHFANNAPPGYFGTSELKSVISLQDALNKSVIDMIVAMEYISLPQRYVVGMDYEIDEDTGLPKIPFQPSVDRLWMTGNDEAKFGEFKQADMVPLLAVQDSFRSEIARVSGIPLHYMMLTSEHPPTGEALKALEARLTTKVQDRQVSFGDTWEDALIFALMMAGTLSDTDEARLDSKWTDPTPKSLLEEAQTKQIKGVIGVSKTFLLRELGYTDPEIEEMKKEKEEEEQAALEKEQELLKAQTQPAGATSPAVSPTADGQRLDAKGKPTTAKEVTNQGK